MERPSDVFRRLSEGDTSATMRCPICNELLVPTERQGIEIDFCPRCRGVWLDRGELDKIIERSMTAYSPRSYREDDDDYDEHYHRRKRRKSFLKDLFDFD